MTSATGDVGIEMLHAEWSAAIARGDVSAVLELLTEGYELWAPGSPPLRGRESLRPVLTRALQVSEIQPSFRLAERIVAGDVAVEIGWDVQRVRPRAGGDAVEGRQRVFLVLRRDPRGIWRFARGMSNAGPDA
jgi:ketosteroid isomerase-like protein